MRLIQVAVLIGIGIITQQVYAKRVALVIGNAAYQYENKLSNPVNDAILLQNTLKNDLQFDDVKLIKNADFRTLNRAVDEFNQEAQNADVAVIYFSGHGQQGDNRQNYLLATDAKIEHSADLRASAVTSDDLVNATQGAKARIVILDACRDRPNSGFKSATKGLSRAQISGQGLLVAYATDAGKVAQDGTTGNSPYATALAQALRKKDQPILAMFDEVAERVEQTTKGQQSPTREGNLKINVYFIHPTINVNQNALIANTDAEIVFWDSMKNETDVDSYQAYLQQYPNGRFKVLAETRIKKYSVKPNTAIAETSLVNQTAQQSVTAQTTNNNITDQDELEKAAYTVALEAYKQGGAETAIQQLQNFIKNNPNGRYIEKAYFWLAEYYIAVASYSFLKVDFQAAKQYYTMLVTQYPNNPRASRALYQMWAITKDVDKNITLANQYRSKLLSQYPQSEEAKFIQKK